MGGFSTETDTIFPQFSINIWKECLPAYFEVGRNWFFKFSAAIFQINQVLGSQEILYFFLVRGIFLGSRLWHHQIYIIFQMHGHNILFHSHDQDKNLTIFIWQLQQDKAISARQFQQGSLAMQFQEGSFSKAVSARQGTFSKTRQFQRSSFTKALW